MTVPQDFNINGAICVTSTSSVWLENVPFYFASTAPMPVARPAKPTGPAGVPVQAQRGSLDTTTEKPMVAVGPKRRVLDLSE